MSSEKDIPEIKLKVTSEEVKPVSRKTNIGEIAKNWMVCSKCGQLADTFRKDCEDHGFNSMTLENYFEAKLNKPYIPEEWKYEAGPDLKTQHNLPEEKHV